MIGIFGDGQLSLYLVKASKTLGLETTLYCENNHGPAQGFSTKNIISTFKNTDTLQAFIDTMDVITFENEFVDTTRIKSLSSDLNKFHPSLETIALVQNKWHQKELFSKLNIPTAKAQKISSLEELKKTISHPVVLKWSQFGYDGKGVLLYDSKKTNANVLAAFFENASRLNTAIYSEDLVDYQSELAMVATRSRDETMIFYPLVFSIQKNGICDTVYGPATRFGVSKSLEETAKTILKKIAEELNYSGTFAVEFFLTKSGDLVVNEMAPRVHNSGHYSLNISSASQFENHIRAMTSRSLIPVKIEDCFLMKNLIGPSHFNGRAPQIDSKDFSQGHFYDYYKTEARPGRKMGHLNFNFKNQDLQTTLDLSQQYAQLWESQIKTKGTL